MKGSSNFHVVSDIRRSFIILIINFVVLIDRTKNIGVIPKKHFFEFLLFTISHELTDFDQLGGVSSPKADYFLKLIYKTVWQLSKKNTTFEKNSVFDDDSICIWGLAYAPRDNRLAPTIFQNTYTFFNVSTVNLIIFCKVLSSQNTHFELI